MVAKAPLPFGRRVRPRLEVPESRVVDEKSNEAPVDLEQAQAQLHESLETAKKLVERTKFLLSGDADTDPAQA